MKALLVFRCREWVAEMLAGPLGGSWWDAERDPGLRLFTA